MTPSMENAGSLAPFFRSRAMEPYPWLRVGGRMRCLTPRSALRAFQGDERDLTFADEQTVPRTKEQKERFFL